MDNPPAIVPGTRMPQFWLGHEAALKDIAGGTEDGQMGAIWSYMSMGKSMPPPVGLGPTRGVERRPGGCPFGYRTIMSAAAARALPPRASAGRPRPKGGTSTVVV